MIKMKLYHQYTTQHMSWEVHIITYEVPLTNLFTLNLI